MAVRKFNPTTPGQRHKVASTFEEVTAGVPEKSLVKGHNRKGGRNHSGKMTIRNVGGGHKRKYREIDFKRDKFGVPGVVKTVEYDPFRSARIALVYYKDGEKRYIVAPAGIEVGQEINSGKGITPEVGNALYLSDIPLGTVIHTVSNSDHQLEVSGKAGRSRWLGRRPRVRGVVMNPVDHPMGGGEGRQSGGHPRSRNGIPAKGFKTRAKKKASNKHIIDRKKK